jgi:hypothetical protein
MQKIAIVGLPRCNKTLLANALSEMTGIPFIQTLSVYEWRTVFNIDGYRSPEWKDMLLIAFCSFFDRVETESHFDQFISDGASFSEFVCLKSALAKNDSGRMKYERNRNVNRLEKICFSYAAEQYDRVVHILMDDDRANDLYVDLYAKYGIPYKLCRMETVESVLKEMANDLDLPMKNTVEGAIFQAKNDLFTGDRGFESNPPVNGTIFTEKERAVGTLSYATCRGSSRTYFKKPHNHNIAVMPYCGYFIKKS